MRKSAIGLCLINVQLILNYSGMRISHQPVSEPTLDFPAVFPIAVGNKNTS